MSIDIKIDELKEIMFQVTTMEITYGKACKLITEICENRASKKRIKLESKIEKVTLSWSKEEHDWITRYPEWKNRNARILGNNFFSMIQEFEKYKGDSLRTVIENAGFNSDSFNISVIVKL